jgi:hypothetical protein
MLDYLNAAWTMLVLFWKPILCLLVMVAGLGYMLLEYIAHRFGKPEIDINHYRRMK